MTLPPHAVIFNNFAVVGIPVLYVLGNIDMCPLVAIFARQRNLIRSITCFVHLAAIVACFQSLLQWHPIDRFLMIPV